MEVSYNTLLCPLGFIASKALASVNMGLSNVALIVTIIYTSYKIYKEIIKPLFNIK